MKLHCYHIFVVFYYLAFFTSVIDSLGEFCDDNNPCNNKEEECDDIEKKCVCKFGYTDHGFGIFCVPCSYGGDSQASNSDGVYCRGLGPNDLLETKDDSAGNKRFVCSQEAVFVPSVSQDAPYGSCHKRVKNFEEDCLHDEQCGDDKICLKENPPGPGKCICREGLNSQDPTDFKCLEYATEVGDQCEQIEQCENLGETGDVMCTDLADPNPGTCQCTKDVAVPSSDNTKCLKLQNIGSSCEEDTQCNTKLEFSYCGRKSEVSDLACQCFPNYVFADLKCLEYATEVGDQCEQTEQCENLGETGDVMCTDLADPNPGTCQCTKDVAVPSRDNTKCLKLQDIGTKCEENVQCKVQFSYCTRESEVSDLACQCLPDYVLYSGKCIPLSDIGGVCEEDIQCPQGSICDPNSTTCECLNNAIPGPDPNKCYQPAASLGAKCEFTAQCAAFDAQCLEDDSDPSKDFTCQCNPTTHYADQTSSECLPFPEKIGDQCGEPSHCNALGDDESYTDCHIDLGICECVANVAIPSTDNSKCLKIADNNELCEEDIQCLLESSYCVRQSENENPEFRCECIPTFIYYPGVQLCVEKAAIGENCEYDIQCPSFSECNPDGKCECSSNNDIPGPDPYKCYEHADKLGDLCEFTAQCAHLQAQCLVDASGPTEMFTCQCNPTTHYSDANDLACLPYPEKLGDSCGDSTHCNHLGNEEWYTECDMSSNDCQCNANFAVPSADNSKCLKISEIQEPCEEDIQCYTKTVKSYCTRHDENFPFKCDCFPHFVFHSDTSECVEKAGINETCKYDIQCPTDSKCPTETGVCTCSNDTTIPGPDVDKCYRLADKLGDPCEILAQCQNLPEAQCIAKEPGVSTDFTCQCNPVTHMTSPDGSKCLRYAEKIGEECILPAQCANLGDSDHFTICQDFCQCNEDVAIPSTDQSQCLEIRNFQETCIDDVQCFASDEKSYCNRQSANDQTKICQCFPNFVPTNEIKPRCLEKLSFNDPCEDSVQCPSEEGSICNVVCTCSEGFIVGPENDKCYKLAEKHGDPCKYDEQCQKLPGSQCLEDETDNSVCQCHPDTHVANPDDPDDRTCYPLTPNIGGTCNITAQCQIELSECSSGNICICSGDTSYVDETGKCYKRVPLDRVCEDSFECKVVDPFSYCASTELCDCLPDAIRWNNICFENKFIGDPCGEDQECIIPIENSFCDRRDQICLCLSPYETSEDGSACILAFSGGKLTSVVNFYVISVCIMGMLILQG